MRRSNDLAGAAIVGAEAIPAIAEPTPPGPKFIGPIARHSAPSKFYKIEWPISIALIIIQQISMSMFQFLNRAIFVELQILQLALGPQFS
jgi:hypothetical protein